MVDNAYIVIKNTYQYRRFMSVLRKNKISIISRPKEKNDIIFRVTYDNVIDKRVAIWINENLEDVEKKAVEEHTLVYSLDRFEELEKQNEN